MTQIRIVPLEKLEREKSRGIAQKGTRAAGLMEGLGLKLRHLLPALLRVSAVRGGKSLPGLI